jgi:hypothetical protein
MSKPQVPLTDGQRIVNRHELGNYEAPLYRVATNSKQVVVYYEGDNIPEFLIPVATPE